ncbi:MAG: chemotaxis protein CheW [Pseudomonadota bacterium]
MSDSTHKKSLEPGADIDDFRNVVGDYLNSLLAEAGANTHNTRAEQEKFAAEIKHDARTANVSRCLPPWAQQAFQVVRFTAGELSMAVPVRDMFGLVDTGGAWVPPRAGAPDWWVGTVSFQSRLTPVIDPYFLVLPAQFRALAVRPPASRITKVIVTADGRFGVGVDTIDKVMTLSATDVAWRGNNSRRRWLHGTVRQHLCAILDTEELDKLVVENNVVV